jgi:glycolate oxidase
MTSGPPAEALARSLAARLPAGTDLVTDPDVMASYQGDRTGFVDAAMPAAVVRPRTTAEVRETVLAATQLDMPIVPRGAGSGLSGGCAGLPGCLVLSLERMRNIVAIDPDDLVVVTEPGVITGELKAAVATHGLAYPPDPASVDFCTIGGNIATNAGGLCCIKYGVTRDYVLALELVLADGRVVRTGRRSLKGVAGYDLTALFVGSEGTLGIVTEATLRLRPAAAPPLTVVATFGSLAAAGRAVVEVARAGVVPSMFELMDRETIRAVESWKSFDLDTDAAALVITQTDAAGAGAEEARRMHAVFEAAGATFSYAADDPSETDHLVAARKLAYPALERLGAVLLDDVAVPRSQITALLVAVEHVAVQHGLRIATFGHAGDGNFHPTIVYQHTDANETARAVAAFEAIVGEALRLGGTCTGEHGVGRLKATLLAAEQSADEIELQRAVKRALDPDGLLNPGCILPDAGRLALTGSAADA